MVAVACCLGPRKPAVLFARTAEGAVHSGSAEVAKGPRVDWKPWAQVAPVLIIYSLILDYGTYLSIGHTKPKFIHVYPAPVLSSRCPQQDSE